MPPGLMAPCHRVDCGGKTARGLRLDGAAGPDREAHASVTSSDVQSRFGQGRPSATYRGSYLGRNRAGARPTQTPRVTACRIGLIIAIAVSPPRARAQDEAGHGAEVGRSPTHRASPPSGSGRGRPDGDRWALLSGEAAVLQGPEGLRLASPSSVSSRSLRKAERAIRSRSTPRGTSPVGPADVPPGPATSARC